jgi:hypothetical protein
MMNSIMKLFILFLRKLVQHFGAKIRSDCNTEIILNAKFHLIESTRKWYVILTHTPF